MASEECKSCRAPIWWCVKDPEEINPKTHLPKTNPINAESIGDPKGNIEVWSEPVIPVKNGEPAYVLKFRYLKKGQEPAEGHRRAISHFATCEHADQWRGRPRGGWPAGSNGEAENR
jgi:hypothetical protein